jgi:hypothetical protein
VRFTRRHLVLRLAAFLPATAQLRADLEAVRAIPNLERRASKALENAGRMLDRARAAYLEGDVGGSTAALLEVSESVELAYKSLRDTGKDPRRNSKHFKRAEISTRGLLRRLTTFRDEQSYNERETAEKVIETVRRVNKDLLNDIMGGER